MSHDARSVANYLIQKAIDDGAPLTPIQVLKLVYYCQGWSLARLDDGLISQPIEAWKYGPVIQDVYFALNHYVDQPIDKTIRGHKLKFNKEEKGLMDRVYDLYGGMNAFDLIGLTHLSKSPWSKVWNEHGGTIRNKIIPKNMIKEFFIEKDKKNIEVPENSGQSG